MAAHEEIREAQALGREVILHLDVRAMLIESSTLSTKEVGLEWLALLQGRPSAFSQSVHIRSRAPARRRISGWQTTRLRIFERDGWACTYCGSTTDLECDHVIPFSRGGSSNDDNLTTACKPCNRAKRALSPEEWRR